MYVMTLRPATLLLSLRPAEHSLRRSGSRAVALTQRSLPAPERSCASNSHVLLTLSLLRCLTSTGHPPTPGLWPPSLRDSDHPYSLRDILGMEPMTGGRMRRWISSLRTMVSRRKYGLPRTALHRTLMPESEWSHA